MGLSWVLRLGLGFVKSCQAGSGTLRRCQLKSHHVTSHHVTSSWLEVKSSRVTSRQVDWGGAAPNGACPTRACACAWSNACMHGQLQTAHACKPARACLCMHACAAPHIQQLMGGEAVSHDQLTRSQIGLGATVEEDARIGIQVRHAAPHATNVIHSHCPPAGQTDGHDCEEECAWLE